MNQAPQHLGGPPEKMPQNAPADPVFKKARVGLNTRKHNMKHNNKQNDFSFKAFFDGQEAFYEGKDHCDNPYRNYDDEDPKNWDWSQWDAGWWSVSN